MKTKLVPLFALLFSCGPLPEQGPFPVDVSIAVENRYAESLFTLDWQGTRDGQPAGARVLDSARVAAGDRLTRKAAFQADSTTPLRLVFSSMSLGTAYTFPAVDTQAQSGTHLFVYDYDLATAAFTVSHRWTY